MKQSLKLFQKSLTEQGLDFTFINNPENIAYLTDYQSEPHERIVALLVFPESDPILFVPELERTEVDALNWPYGLLSYQDHQNPWEIIFSAVGSVCANHSVTEFGIETDHLIVDRYFSLTKQYPQTTTYNISPILTNQKVIKTDQEIKLMKQAGNYADKALEIGIDSLRLGITEAEVVAEIEYQLKKLGISQMSFSTEVLFGDHAASPHGIPGGRALKKNEFVLMDLGVVFEGYTSDITRTVFFGEPSPEEKDLYRIVLNAQENALANCTPGVTASSLDFYARSIITQSGLGEYFNHRLGHGIGMSVHEFPNIMTGNDYELKEGMCFSIEPGIYIPDKVGIRIEDCLYLTKSGHETFTNFQKDPLLLISIK
ncbi:M24 family metallopeptidase [Lacticigenium naphthae]|uniref:M24 family metallopeptidase n=1 Tax=Lacticigenium naphthae TaxID=515351 RepID=UPI00040C75BE|nr:Xaa-Pro peptidase family protein [Lacticigenium naphthae]